MTKADVIDSVCGKVGFSKKESAEIVEMVFDTLKDTLERGEKIKLSGFGNFVVREKKSRVGRNPQTGQEIGSKGPLFLERNNGSWRSLRERPEVEFRDGRAHVFDAV